MKSNFELGINFSYLKEMSLEHIKCFSKEQKVKFSKNGKPFMWTMILGDNGTGKSTILKSIIFTLLEGRETFPPMLYSSFARDYKRDSYIKVLMLNENKIQKTITSLDLGEDHKTHFSTNLMPGFKYPIFAYGSYRRSGNTGLNSETFSQSKTLWDENAFLINAEDWFLQTDYRDSKKPENVNQLGLVKNLLLNILKEEVSDIKILEEGSLFVVRFKTRYGWVRFNELSSGYRSLISWMVDLTNWLTKFYPNSLNHFHEPAIVLVDEIDLHLHVSLQRTLVEFLTTTFPNIQFVVTAHSPLVIQGSQDENIVLLEKENDHVEVSHNPINVKNWRIDQILTSDLFGLESSRSLETEKKLNRRAQLLTKDSLNKSEQNEMKALNLFADNTPYYEDKDLDEASRIIKEAAATLKKIK